MTRFQDVRAAARGDGSSTHVGEGSPSAGMPTVAVQGGPARTTRDLNDENSIEDESSTATTRTPFAGAR